LDLYNKFQNEINELTVLRLLGLDGKEIEKMAGENWNKIYINRIKEISSIAEMINQLQVKEVDLFVNVNNHFEGSAPLTIERIKSKL
jgi:hypothetical protein